MASGAGIALLAGTAGCVAGLDATKIDRLPDTTGMSNKVVIRRAQGEPL